MADLAAPANRLMIRYPDGSGGYAFRVAGLTVWGFTAMLLDRVLALAGFEQPWDSSRLTSLRRGRAAGGLAAAAREPRSRCLMPLLDISGPSQRRRRALPHYKLMLCPVTCST